jgi:hypothetical protein
MLASTVAATEKISVTIGREELRGAKRIASRLGLSLSTFISDAVRERIERQARKEAGLAVLDMFDPEDLASDDEMTILVRRWQTATPALPGEDLARQKSHGELSRTAKAKKKRARKRH